MEGQPALTGRIDPPPDASAESILCPPLSILDESLFGSESLDRMVSGCLDGNISEDGTGCYFASEEPVTGLFEEEVPISCQDVADFCQALPTTAASCSLQKEFITQQSLHFFCDRENYSGNHFVASEAVSLHVDASDAIGCGLVYSCTTSHPCGLVNVEGNCESNSSYPATRRRNPKRAASLKSIANIAKTGLKVGKKHVKTSKKVVGGLSNVIWESLKKATRKRSFRNHIHSSVWGALDKIYKLFEQDDGGLFQNAHEISSKKCSRKAASYSRGKRSESKSKKVAKKSRRKAASTTNSMCSEDSISHLPELVGSALFKRDVADNCVANNKDHLDIACNQFDFLESSITSPEKDIHHVDKEPDSSVTEEVFAENNSTDMPGVSSQTIPHSLEDSSEDGIPIYPSTSPESDVIHPTADAGTIASDGVTSTDQEPPPLGAGFVSKNDNVMDSSTISSLIFQQTTGLNMGNILIEDKSGMPSKSGTYSVGEMPDGFASFHKPGKFATCSNFGFQREDLNSLKKYNRKVGKKLNKKFLNQELQLGKLSGETVDLSGFPESFQCKNGKHRCLLPFADGRMKDAEVGKSNGKTPSCIESAERQNPGRRSKSDKGFTSKHTDKRKVVKEMSACVAFSGKEDELALTDCLGMHTACSLYAVEESTKYHGMQNACVLSATTELTKTSVDGGNLPGFNRSSAENSVGSEAIYINDKSETRNFVGQDSETICSQERAWVCCDDCSKWRCISEKLADIIDETKCRWTCKDNDDKMFADCSIPQEKSNSEINAELGIPDEEVVCDMQQNITFTDSSNLDANKRAPWVSIRSNMFLHRSRKKQTIDEIMVCHCKPPLDGSMGCTDDCLNRMLNIECVRGTCPCGDLCSNQQFQKRKYTKMKWFRSGNKGFGLKLQEKVSEGDFLIEYVGEVLDMATYEARQREYAYRGQEHFYFMTLNSHEVIDACNKGNLGRFINHSCEPNCRTEKWMVKGEVCIGLFALRDIKKGEELTFDYNYVRVVGAAAKKCFCESAQCRGFIGSDPLNSECIGHGDSDEEYPGPMKICNDGAEFALNERVSGTAAISDEIQKDSDRKLNSQDVKEAIGGVSDQQHGKFSVCAKNIKIDNSESEDLLSTEETASESVFNNQPSEISGGMNTVSKSLTEASLENKITVPAVTSEHRMDKPQTSSKLPHLSGNKNSGSVKPLFQKSKKTNGDGCRPQFEGVEDKLNTLLDSDGGISKRKDCTKGYLKLLVVTAASNNAENEAIQSTRDLSLIIDALLKTKSRTVLTDIINKNGLQMLHNIMKQNRKNNIKIPILRKLLKVIEFLAAKGILTVEQINMDPTCVGVESFRDSIISLMYHSDIQVHQIARSFRDRWIPRTYKRASQVQRDRCLFDSHNENAGPLLPCKRQVDLIVGNGDTPNATSQRIRISSADTERHSSADMCITSQKASDFVDEAGCTMVNVTKIRKRKSRWDQDKPPDKIRCASMASVALEDASMKADSFQIADANSQTGKETTSSNRFQQDVDDEVPPGFDSPPGFSHHYKSENHVAAVNISANCADVVIGQVQERFLSQLPVSHGIPLALMQQLGTPANGSNQYFESWTVAPGMPFYPFPPLPPYPRKELNDVHGPSSSSCSADHHLIASTVTERSRLTGQFISSSQCDASVPCISNEMFASVSMMGMGDPHNSEGWCRSSGRCSFRPEKSNNRGYHRFEPPWSRHRISRQFKGNMRCGMQGRALENSRKKVGDACDPNGVKGEEVGSTYHQQPKDS